MDQYSFPAAKWSYIETANLFDFLRNLNGDFNKIRVFKQI